MTTTQNLQVLHAALSYASGEALGWPVPVFPTKNKRPVTPNGFKDETTDPATIKRWFANDYDLACRPYHMRCVVIDVDTGHDPRDLAGLPPTYTVRSPRGGLHLYYATDLKFGNRRWSTAIDTRSEAGYVNIPPSANYQVIDNREPVPLPDWAAARLAKSPERAETSSTDTVDRIRLEHTLKRINPNDHPSYDEWAAVLAMITGSGGDADLAIEWSSGRLGGFHMPSNFCGDDYEMADKLASFQRTGADAAGFGSLMKLAYPPEPPAPPKPTPKERFPHHDPIEDYDLLELTYFDDEKTMPRVPGGAVLLVVGPKGTHKTGLVMMKCLTSTARTLYIATEGAHGIRKSRLKAYQRTLKIPADVLRATWRTVPERFCLTSLADHVDLFAAYQGWAPEIIVIDVLAKSAPGNYADMEIVIGILAAAEALAEKFDALVILTTHPSKKGKDAAGSMFFGALTYAEWHVAKIPEGVKCTIEKMKDGEAEFDIIYPLQHGNPPVVMPDGISAEEIRRRTVKATGPDPLKEAVRAALQPGAEISVTELSKILRDTGYSGACSPSLLREHCASGYFSEFSVKRGKVWFYRQPEN